MGKEEYLITRKFNILYADPPWKYERNKVQGAAERHYPTMSIEQLCALDVEKITDETAHYFYGQPFRFFPKPCVLSKRGALRIRQQPLSG